MSEICQFPLCKSHAMPSGFCVSHNKYFGSKEVKEAKKIPIKSVKRKVEDKLLMKMFKEEKAKDPRCKIKSPICTGEAQCFDHVQKTSPKNRIKRSNLKLSCFACNNYKEQFPEWSKKTGNHISRFKKDEALK